MKNIIQKNRRIDFIFEQYYHLQQQYLSTINNSRSLCNCPFIAKQRRSTRSGKNRKRARVRFSENGKYAHGSVAAASFRTSFSSGPVFLLRNDRTRLITETVCPVSVELTFDRLIAVHQLPLSNALILRVFFFSRTIFFFALIPLDQLMGFVIFLLFFFLKIKFRILKMFETVNKIDKF